VRGCCQGGIAAAARMVVISGWYQRIGADHRNHLLLIVQTGSLSIQVRLTRTAMLKTVLPLIAVPASNGCAG
jgi:hypothetical protein